MTADALLIVCGSIVALAVLAACAVARLALALTELAEAVKDYLDGAG